MASEIVRARLEGKDARLGDVRARDVAQLIIGFEQALAAAAYLSLGRRRASSGRHTAAVEAASRLRFVGVEQGSVVAVLAPPPLGGASADGQFVVNVADLFDSAFARLAEAFDESADIVDQRLAAALASLADSLGIGERNERLILTRAGSPTEVRLDQAVRTRMEAATRRPAPVQRADRLVGTLVEADFEKRTARLQPPTGGGVLVHFEAALDDAIYEALRGSAQIEGRVTYDPKTALAKEVDVVSVYPPEQLPLRPEQFWAHQTVTELAAEQGIVASPDLRGFADNGLSDDEREDLLEVLAEFDA